MEKKLIDWLRDRYGETQFASVGIGDDCAVLQRIDGQLVLTTDAICEGVHFDSSTMTPQQIGRKALAVNLSDLASMGAAAKSVLVSLTLPRTSSFEFACQLFEGMDELARQFQVEICGGDTNIWDGDLVVSVTAIGIAPQKGVWKMSGAKPGDEILVTGYFGGSILNKHWACLPRLEFANRLRDTGLINACTDVSDSLGVDLCNVADASGVGFELDLDRVPLSEDAAKYATQTGNTALHHAMTDGEDFELLMAVDPANVSDITRAAEKSSDGLNSVSVTAIGRFTEAPEFTSIEAGVKIPFTPSGYEHRLESEEE